MDLNCLIVDDEPLALDLMESYVKKTPFLVLKGKCSNASDVLKIISTQAIDLVYMDIQMPGLNGLELSSLLGDDTKVIFTTAFEQYAVEGFKSDALDYLLKPISYTEFLRATNKAVRWFDLLNAKKDVRTSIFVKSDYKLLKIELSNIIYIEGLRDYVKIVLENSQHPIVCLMNMKALEDELPQDSFMRVHRSYIVNMTKIKVVERNRIVFGKAYIPISDTYKAKFQTFLDKLSL